MKYSVGKFEIMGPVGQIVKILFYMILAMELVFSIVIYAMATILLCSRIFIPQNILLHGSIALFLSIVTLSVIHRGFQAVAHDCPFHLYCFAIILVALLLIQFLFEIFGIRSTSSNVWYQQQSLPIYDLSSQKFDLDENVEKISIEDLDKMAYRVPTSEELDARKNQLYGTSQDKPEKKKRTRWNHGSRAPPDIDQERVYEKSPSHRRKIGRRRDFSGNGEKFEEDKRFRKGREGNTEEPTTPQTVNQTERAEEKLTNTPLVLAFHGYSFILKMVCVALSILTGFMYQLEYV